MNRSHHFKKTFPQNILDNESYENLEFILLDYNSKDDLEAYVLTHFEEHLISGRLVYYKTTNPQFYNMSNSRNVAFKLAEGEIICNIDADNYTGPGFADYINETFKKNSNIFLSTHNQTSFVRNDVLGRICVSKSDFFAVGGYEERMKHYGFDDIDFTNRLKALGLKEHSITNPDYLTAISHSNIERMANGVDDNVYHSVLINYINSYESELIILLKTSVFKKATMTNTFIYNVMKQGKKKVTSRFEFAILEDLWTEGNWEIADRALVLKDKQRNEVLMSDKINNRYICKDDEKEKIYYELSNAALLEEIFFFYNQVSNRIIMEDNLDNKKVRANIDGFGVETLYRNFNKETPIYI